MFSAEPPWLWLLMKCHHFVWRNHVARAKQNNPQAQSCGCNYRAASPPCLFMKYHVKKTPLLWSINTFLNKVAVGNGKPCLLKHCILKAKNWQGGLLKCAWGDKVGHFKIKQRVVKGCKLCVEPFWGARWVHFDPWPLESPAASQPFAPRFSISAFRLNTTLCLFERLERQQRGRGGGWRGDWRYLRKPWESSCWWKPDGVE